MTVAVIWILMESVLAFTFAKRLYNNVAEKFTYQNQFNKSMIQSTMELNLYLQCL